MSTTILETTKAEEPKYEYFFKDNHWNNKREILTGDKVVKTFDEIPVVDITDIFSDSFDERLRVAQEIAVICKEVGFMYVKNHGVPQDLVDEMFEVSRQYHALPFEDKMADYVFKSETLRGYDIHYTNTPNGIVQKKGSFLYSYDCDKDPEPPMLTPEQRALCVGQHNRFPVNQPHFKEVLEEYQKHMLILARRMMRTFALGLGAEETYFDSTVTAPYTSILLNYYPPQAPDGDDPESLVAHSDFETFTILSQDMLGGLEVLNKNGIYIPAKPMHGTFVVNVGDFLQRISNDIFVSTVHRVRNLTGFERYSIPFFFSFNMDVEIPVLPCCTSENNPAKYGPRNLNEYTAQRRENQRKKHEEALKNGALEAIL
ncbi:hypothetical protein B7463_g3851, partial [Scytalidium lignicola]